MSMARVVIMAVVLEGRSKSAVARDYGVSRRWVQVLVARYRAEGDAAFEPPAYQPAADLPGRRGRDRGAAQGAGWGGPGRGGGDHCLASAPAGGLRSVGGDDLADLVPPRVRRT